MYINNYIDTLLLNNLSKTKKNILNSSKQLDKLKAFNDINCSNSTKRFNNLSSVFKDVRMTTLESQARGCIQGNKNTQDGISLIQVADNSLDRMTSSAQKLRELAVKYNNNTLTDSDKVLIEEEAKLYLKEIQDSYKNTYFNGVNVFSKDEYYIQTGANTSEGYTINFNNFGSKMDNFFDKVEGAIKEPPREPTIEETPTPKPPINDGNNGDKPPINDNNNGSNNGGTDTENKPSGDTGGNTNPTPPSTDNDGDGNNPINPPNNDNIKPPDENNKPSPPIDGGNEEDNKPIPPTNGDGNTTPSPPITDGDNNIGSGDNVGDVGNGGTIDGSNNVGNSSLNNHNNYLKYIEEQANEAISGKTYRDGYIVITGGNGWTVEGNVKNNKIDGYVNIYNEKNEVVFSGEFKDGSYGGAGRVYKDGQNFAWGIIDNNYKVSGYGEITYDDGSKYFGNLENSIKKGQGLLQKADGTMLNGIWDGDNFKPYWDGDNIESYGVLKANFTEKASEPALSMKDILNVDFIDNNLINPMKQVSHSINVQSDILSRRIDYNDNNLAIYDNQVELKTTDECLKNIKQLAKEQEKAQLLSVLYADVLDNRRDSILNLLT